MAVEVMVPRLGWSMDSGIFNEWLKQDGDNISPGDALFSIEADKAVEEVESEDAGLLYILPDVAQPGLELPVGTVIGWILAEGEPIPETTSLAPQAQRAFADATAEVIQAGGRSRPEVAVEEKRVSSLAAERTTPRPKSDDRQAASSPRARRIAKELHVDWRQAIGTGKGGRIVEHDVRALADTLAAMASGPSTMTTLRVDAGLAELSGLLDRLVESGEETERIHLYRALLVRLAVVAYRLTIGRERETEVPRVYYGIAGSHGFSFSALDGANLSSGRDTAARISSMEAAAADSVEATPATGADEDCLRIVDLSMLGIDEFAQGDHSHCPLLSFGRVRRDAGAGESTDQDAIRIALSFEAGSLDLRSGAEFLKKACSAVEQALLFLAL